LIIHVLFISRVVFSSVSETRSHGIVALEEICLQSVYNYKSGIFPWFEDGEPITWWSPDPRMVLFLDELVVSKSMRNILNRNIFTVTFNQNFREVISNCQNIKRDGQDGTWITNDMIEAYCKLNELGIAKSIEVWQNEELVGGLYGIDLGRIFLWESMFSKVSNASKVAFISLVKQLQEDNYKLLDCQVYNPHLESLGREIDRVQFMDLIRNKD
jgi:leucyl/phenylalanyl-tRNA--protein transferase